MDIHSLGWRTDLMFRRFDGEIIDRGDYLAIRTPSNPSFYWGNFLFFASPPTREDTNRWMDLFDREIAADLPVRHRAFGWDTPGAVSGAIAPFLDLGFSFQRQIGLVTRRIVSAPHPAEGVAVRTISGDDEWRLVFENQMLEAPKECDRSLHAVYLRRRVETFRHMTETGRGAWFGAFLEGRMVGDLGLFHDGIVGRFQEVETHPDFRCRGICGTLVAAAVRHALEAWKLESVVLVAERGADAERIYLSLGFEAAEELESLERRPCIR